MHLNRAIQAAEALGGRFESLVEDIGAEGAQKAVAQAESYLERAKREFDKAEQVVREMSGR